MNINAIAFEIVYFAAIVGLVLWRQLATRRVRDGYRIPLIMGILGIAATGQLIGSRPLHAGLALSFVLGLAVSFALAKPRADSLRVWRTADGTLMRRGTWRTLLWWVAVFAARLAIGAVVPVLVGVPRAEASAFSSVSILVSVAATLAAQQWFLQRRIARGGAARVWPTLAARTPERVAA